MTRSEIYNQVCKTLRKSGAKPSLTAGYIADLVIRCKQDPAAFYGTWLTVLQEEAEKKQISRAAMSQAIYRLISECSAHDGCRTLCDQLGIVAQRPTPRTLILYLADLLGA